MKKIVLQKTALLAAVFALLLLLAASPMRAGAANEITPVSNTGFLDVPRGAWYEEALLLMQNYTPGIVSGIRDADGVTRFHPDEPISRAAFLKMAMVAAEGFTVDRSRDDHWAGQYYTIAMENNVLIADAFSGSEPVIPYDAAVLEQPLTRYEAAVILTNACVNMQMETLAVVGTAASGIKDYAEIQDYTPDAAKYGRGVFTNAVEQAWGKGLLSTQSDGAFHGAETLSRAEAAMAIFRQINWKDSRSIPSGVSVTTPEITVAKNIDPNKSFAFWLQNGHLNGSTPDAEARELLFGDASRSYFTSAAQAEMYMTNVTFPMWAIDKTGNKYSTTGTLQVHKLVADEVLAIFEMIYNDAERFPIYAYSVGGARFSDAMRHAWGCAIDINPYYNAECNFRSGSLRVTCGYGWWPAGMDGQTWVGRGAASYHGSLTEASPYSIRPGGSVVRAFAAYGWGWGGSGTNNPNAQPKGWSSGNSFDFMHFSVLPTGG